MRNKVDEHTRPITLYVEQVKKEVDLSHVIERRRVTVIDVELSEVHAQELVKLIQSTKVHGAITVRLVGRLVLA